MACKYDVNGMWYHVRKNLLLFLKSATLEMEAASSTKTSENLYQTL
jgi:hypothetical protein